MAKDTYIFEMNHHPRGRFSRLGYFTTLRVGRPKDAPHGGT
ncbi:hypothetical protein HNQ92_004157 [Rhabdobacter roseus]|uniref:Uncharacterized protein n=1 Tax=Rhabdobacter roseus TaxID=1655419 RepID=A0A840TWN1_9BACT|nr:hypothetical protein [Rhabdobacter roseus]MBB5285997.1 hypothetical protein [Rhabdobacter roseus]